MDPIPVLMVPHGVGQSQDAQDEEVDGQQQVDIFLGEHLQDGARSVRTGRPGSRAEPRGPNSP